MLEGVSSSPRGHGSSWVDGGPKGHPQLGDAVGVQIAGHQPSASPSRDAFVGWGLLLLLIMLPGETAEVWRPKTPGAGAPPVKAPSAGPPLLSRSLWAAFYPVMPHLVSLLPTSTLPGASLADRKGQYLLWGSLPWGIEGASSLHLQVGYGGRSLGSGPRWTAWG